MLTESGKKLPPTGDVRKKWRQRWLLVGMAAGFGIGSVVPLRGAGTGVGTRHGGPQAGIATVGAGAAGAAADVASGGRSRAPVPRGPPLLIGMHAT